MSANPPKNDAWPPPRRWHHVWVRFDRSNFPPHPGLILFWMRSRKGWRAWVVWVDQRMPEDRPRFGWVDAEHLRPAVSDRNVWNDGPWR